VKRPAVHLLVLISFAAAGCRQGLFNQQKLKPLRPSALWDDGSSARPLPAGTIPRGFLREDRAYFAAQGPDGKFVVEIPVKVTKELLLRGQERFDIFCSPCHGRTGDGLGMIVQRGFKRPTSFHAERLRNERIGYFFDVMTNGFVQMSSYASQVSVDDRWAIAAYVRTLQLSRDLPVALLEGHDVRQLQSAPIASPDPLGPGPVPPQETPK
jgi:mono/diheme cytochrome c family protein